MNHVRVIIEGGKVIHVESDTTVELQVVDYDMQGIPADRLSTDAQGRRCVIESSVVSGGNDHSEPPWLDLLCHLSQQPEPGFVVLTEQPEDPETQRFEAWAYRGQLDFDRAEPVCFGVGPNLLAALHALDSHLGEMNPGDSRPTTP